MSAFVFISGTYCAAKCVFLFALNDKTRINAQKEMFIADEICGMLLWLSVKGVAYKTPLGWPWCTLGGLYLQEQDHLRPELPTDVSSFQFACWKSQCDYVMPLRL